MLFKLFLTSSLVVSLILPCFSLNVTVGTSNANYITDGINDEVEIQAAINAVNTAGGGTVTLKDGSYNIQTTYILPKSNVILSGTSRNSTILTSTRSYSYLIWTNNIAVSKFFIQNMTINALNSDHASGVLLEKASNCRVSNVKFTGVTCGGWDLVVGIDGTAAGTDNDFSRNIVIENCLFDGHQGSLEMLLLFNTKNCRVDNCTFQNKTTGCAVDGNRPVLGLWQKTDSISIVNCTFLNNNSREAIYHSNTCDNTLIENCTFTNTGGIHGANESDWGTFGVPYEKRLAIRNCTMTAGANDFAETAIKLGAIEGVLIKDCTITGYEEGMVIQSGLAASLPAGAKHFAVVRTNIRNGNPANNVHALHAGILFQKVAGKIHGFFICGDISSNLSPPKQEQAVAFESYPNPITFDSLFWLGTTVNSYNTRPKFAFLDAALQGSPFVVETCNGANPPSYCSECATTMSDAAIEAKIRTYDAVAANIIRDLLAYQANSIVLPIELLDFKGKAEQKGNYLTWTFADIKALHSVAIEKSKDGVNFINYRKDTINRTDAINYVFTINRTDTINHIFAINRIDTINRINTMTKTTQSTTDETPFDVTYYRLNTTELNGKSRFSKVIAVARDGGAINRVYTEGYQKQLKIYPNPANDELTIENAEGEDVSIVNILGQVVVQFPHTINQSSLSIYHLKSGVYFVKTANKTVRFVKSQ